MSRLLAIEDAEDEVEDLLPGAIREELWSDEPLSTGHHQSRFPRWTCWRT